MSVTKINEDTVEIQANCVTTNSDGPNTINWTMNFEVLKNQEIFELVNNVHYGWGITLDDNNELLQIYEGGGSNGLVHIHWPPQVLQEE